jgi:hypothetical protein
VGREALGKNTGVGGCEKWKEARGRDWEKDVSDRDCVLREVGTKDFRARYVILRTY